MYSPSALKNLSQFYLFDKAKKIEQILLLFGFLPGLRMATFGGNKSSHPISICSVIFFRISFASQLLLLFVKKVWKGFSYKKRRVSVKVEVPIQIIKLYSLLFGKN